MATEKIAMDGQQAIIKNFIQEFFPPCKLRHELSNELMYVHTVALKVFKKKFGFSVSVEDFLEICLVQGYQVSTRKASFDMISRLYKPDKDGTFINSNPLYKKYNAAFIYLNMDGKEVHKLMKTVFVKPLYAVVVREDMKQLTEERLARFKAEHLHTTTV